MNGRFVWADGQLEILPGFSNTHHYKILTKMFAENRIQHPIDALVGGWFREDNFNDLPIMIRREWEQGDQAQIPTDQELGVMIGQELRNYGRVARYQQRIAELDTPKLNDYKWIYDGRDDKLHVWTYGQGGHHSDKLRDLGIGWDDPNWSGGLAEVWENAVGEWVPEVTDYSYRNDELSKKGIAAMYDYLRARHPEVDWEWWDDRLPGGKYARKLAADELRKWVYIRGRGGDVWDDIEFSRSMENDFYSDSNNWIDEDAVPYDDEIVSHLEKLGELIGLHLDYRKMNDWKKLQEVLSNSPYAMGLYDEYKNEFTGEFANGCSPNEVNQELWDGEAKFETGDLRDSFGATSEDTEPVGANVGFLGEPHKDLYPPLFRGEKKIPVSVSGKLKAHVLNALEEDFNNPDGFIYFTIYGSGLSYNWDEGGDLDIQMWVDIEKYQDLQKDETPMSMDDLLAAVRRRVQTVNFPSFKDLGLTAPSNAKEKTDSSMLIQYYAKPGKGTKEENIASQPYACYDLETDDWIVRPKPIKPTFYGNYFLDLMPKAKDMAIQAEALIGEYERNILNWQFWTSLAGRYKSRKFKEQAQEAMENATMEKEGIKKMFEGVFGGRAEAYSPGGKGIEDERDLIQKLLEVWGIFQELKHYARATLPWEEIEMPKETAKVADTALSYEEMVRFILQNGGATFVSTWKGFNPYDSDHGYAVSLAGKEKTFPAGTFNTDALLSYIQTSWNEGQYLGAWVDDGIVYLDVTEIVEDLPTAIQMGRDNGQTAIWDFANNKEIRVDEFKTSGWRLQKTADWGDIMDKAQRYRQEGRVKLLTNTPTHVVSQSSSENDPNALYNNEIWIDEPGRGTITRWNCDCQWGDVSWGRTRQFKRYEGRPCAHTLAAYWESLTQPKQPDEGIAPQQQIPGMNPQNYLQQGLPGQQVQPQAPQSQPSILVQPQDAQNEQLTLPGTFSKWRKIGLFENGDYVRALQPVDGIDDRGTVYIVPRNMVGEVIWSDEVEAIVIFSINSGPLGPHNVRVTTDPENFVLVPRTRGTAPRRRH